MIKPRYDESLRLRDLSAVRRSFLLYAEKEGKRVDKAALAKLDQLMASRIRPSEKQKVTKDMPTSRIMYLRARHMHLKQRMPNRWTADDAKYVKQLDAALKARRSESITPAVQRARLEYSKGYRPKLDPDTPIAMLEQLDDEYRAKDALGLMNKRDKQYRNDIKHHLQIQRQKQTVALKKKKQQDAPTAGAVKSELPKSQRKELTKGQEKRLSDLYYGELPMGRETLYHAMLQQDGPVPSKSSIQRWINAQKVEQVYAQRRKKDAVGNFLMTSPGKNLSIDLFTATDRGALKNATARDRKLWKGWGKTGYALVVIDNFSRKAWTAALNKKTPVAAASAFRKLLPLIVKETGSHPKSINMDDGEEFKGPFRALLKGGGVFPAHNPGAPNMPTYLLTIDKDQAKRTLRQLAAGLGVHCKDLQEYNATNEKTGDEFLLNAPCTSKLQEGTEINVPIFPGQKEKEITPRVTIGGAPSSNGLVERVVGVLRKALARMWVIKGDTGAGTGWRGLLPRVTAAYNRHFHRVLQTTPADAVRLRDKADLSRLRELVKQQQRRDNSTRPPDLKKGQLVRLRILPPKFNKSSTQSYYSKVMRVRQVIYRGGALDNPQIATHYKLEMAPGQGRGNKKLLSKSYPRSALLTIDEIPGDEKLSKGKFLRPG